MKRPAWKASLLPLTAIIPLGLASCGPQYEDVDIARGVCTTQDGKNTISLTQLNYQPAFNCVLEMNVQEEQYNYYDIKESARLSNLTTNMDYRIRVNDDTTLYPFPQNRIRHIAFVAGEQPYQDGKNDDWAVTFRYSTHRFIFHLELPSAI